MNHLIFVLFYNINNFYLKFIEFWLHAINHFHLHFLILLYIVTFFSRRSLISNINSHDGTYVLAFNKLSSEKLCIFQFENFSIFPMFYFFLNFSKSLTSTHNELFGLDYEWLNFDLKTKTYLSWESLKSINKDLLWTISCRLLLFLISKIV